MWIQFNKINSYVIKVDKMGSNEEDKAQIEVTL